MPKQVINNENSKVQKPKVEAEGFAKQPEKVAAQVKKHMKKGLKVGQSVGNKTSDRRSRRRTLDNSNKSRAHNYPIDNWQEQAQSGITDMFNASAAQQGSVGDAQPSEGLTNVEKVNIHVESIEKAPLR